jgi:hypothetical protein
MSGVELQAARRAAAERFLGIAAKYTPAGCVVEYRKSLSGRACVRQVQRWYQVGEPVEFERWISAPKPVTRRSLAIFLHECAHHFLGHCHGGRSANRTLIHEQLGIVPRNIPAHVRELEAEKQAFVWMRAEGVAVPRKSAASAKGYIRRKIRQARAAGAKTIDAEARRFAR